MLPQSACLLAILAASAVAAPLQRRDIFDSIINVGPTPTDTDVPPTSTPVVPPTSASSSTTSAAASSKASSLSSTSSSVSTTSSKASSTTSTTTSLVVSPSVSTATDGQTSVVFVTSTPSVTAPPAASSSAAAPASDSSSGHSTMIGLGVAGGIAVMGLVGFLVWKFTRKRFGDDEFDDSGAINWPEPHREEIKSKPPSSELLTANMSSDGHYGGHPAASSTAELLPDPYAVPSLPHLNPNQAPRYADDNQSAYYDQYGGAAPHAQEAFQMQYIDPRARSPAPYSVGGRASPAPPAAYGGRSSPGPELAYGGRSSPAPDSLYRNGGGRASPGPEAAYRTGRTSPGPEAAYYTGRTSPGPQVAYGAGPRY